MTILLAWWLAAGAAQATPAMTVKTEDPPIERLHPMLAPVIRQGPFAPTWASLVTPVSRRR